MTLKGDGLDLFWHVYLFCELGHVASWGFCFNSQLPNSLGASGTGGALLLVTILVILGRRAGCSLLGTQSVQTHTTVHLHVKSKRNSVLMPLISRSLVSLVGSCGGGVGGLAAVQQHSGTWLTPGSSYKEKHRDKGFHECVKPVSRVP